MAAGRNLSQPAKNQMWDMRKNYWCMKLKEIGDLFLHCK